MARGQFDVKQFPYQQEVLEGLDKQNPLTTSGKFTRHWVEFFYSLSNVVQQIWPSTENKTVWDTVFCPALPGNANLVADKPDYNYGQISPTERGLAFDDSADEVAEFSVVLPHKYKKNTNVHPYVLAAGTDLGVSSNTNFVVQYSWHDLWDEANEVVNTVQANYSVVAEAPNRQHIVDFGNVQPLIFSNTDYTASANITVVDGSIVGSGSNANILTADGSRLEIAEAAPAGLHFEVEYYGIPATRPQHVVYNGYYEGNPAHNKVISMLNYTAGTYTALTAASDDFPDNTEDQDYQFDVPTAGTENYFSSGNAVVKIEHTSAGASGHYMNTDFMALRRVDVTAATQMRPGSLFQCNITRDVSEDDHSGDVIVMGFGLKYETDKIGSRTQQANAVTETG